MLTPDYDSDPGRWNSWESPQDVHEMVAPERAEQAEVPLWLTKRGVLIGAKS